MSPSDPAPTTPAPRFGPRVIVGVLAFGGLCGALMQSLVIPIQGDLPELLGTDPSNASWVLTATLLAAAVTMPVSGRLADIFGKKPVMLVSAVILLLGSALIAASDTLLPVVVGRALQGVAMGYIPIAISMVREVVPVRMRAGAVALVSATMGVGGAIGLPLSAWVAQEFSWHALFWMSAGLAAVVLVLTAVVVPAVRDQHPAHIDVVGIVGLAVGLSAVLIGVSKGSQWGWTASSTLGAILGGLLVLAAWGWYELRHRDPIVDLRASANRPVLFTNLAAVLIGFGMMGQAIVIPQLLELPATTGHGLGQSLLATGLWMAPAGLMMMLFAPVSSRLMNTVGARITLSIGAFVLSVGYVVSLFLMNAPWQLLLAVCVGAAGVGIGYAAMPTLVMDHTPPAEAASSVGVNALMRSLGTTIAGAVMAAILTSRTTTLAPGLPAIPSESAFQLCFAVAAAAAFVGSMVALLVPRSRPTATTAEPTAEPTADRRSGEPVTAAG